MLKSTHFLSGLLLLGLTVSIQAQEDIEDLREQAIQTAVKEVASSVVSIETSGGTDIIVSGPRGAKIRKGSGPTTGLVVDPNGYIITSSFNFANKPTSIFVSVPGKKEKFVAKVVAKDDTRMLTLLQIKATGLSVPKPMPKKDMEIGQTALAVGRTLSIDINAFPSVSEGIISAKDRVWGKAIQTDAKISPTNYGGPLIDLTGRVQGVLVPASPRSEGATAGFEWYDSGIGFAIPLEDINRVLGDLKAGKNLKKGVLGVRMSSTDMYSVAPKISAVTNNSAASQAGLKSGDVIKEIDGKVVRNYAQVLHALGSKYEGDTVALKIQRGDKEINLGAVKLGGTENVAARAYLGILPMRDDTTPGVEVRYVYPNSPAAKAGIKVGERITRLGPKGRPTPIRNLDALFALMGNASSGSVVEVEVKSNDGKKSRKVSVTLSEMTEEVPEELPKESSKKMAKKPAAGDPKEGEKKVETGLLKRRNAAEDHTYWVYVPETYDPKVSHGVVVWLHPAGKSKEDDVKTLILWWEEYLSANNLILVAPISENLRGWTATEADFVREATRAAVSTYNVDKRRVVLHGMGLGGQLSYYLGFNSRDLYRGVAPIAAVLATKPKDRSPRQPLSFFIVAGEKDPIVGAVKEKSETLKEKKYITIFRQLKSKGHQYFDADTEKTLQELVRWIDSLDRL